MNKRKNPPSTEGDFCSRSIGRRSRAPGRGGACSSRPVRSAPRWGWWESFGRYTSSVTPSACHLPLKGKAWLADVVRMIFVGDGVLDVPFERPAPRWGGARRLKRGLPQSPAATAPSRREPWLVRTNLVGRGLAPAVRTVRTKVGVVDAVRCRLRRRGLSRAPVPTVKTGNGSHRGDG